MNKKLINRIASILLIITIICISIQRLGYILRPTDTDIAFSQIETFHDMPENYFEVIGYGSSHMWRGMNPIELYNLYGIGSYNYGCNWQNINTTLLFLEDSLLTQKPKVVLIETFYVGVYKENQDIDGEIYYTTAINEFKGKKKYLKQAFGENKERFLSYYIPIIAFHDNWINISKSSFIKNRKDVYDFNRTMGFVSSGEVKNVIIPDCNTFQQAELSKGSIEILNKIVDVCNLNNIDIIFYTAPYQGEYQYSNAMKKYAEDNNIVYFNLFELVNDIGFNGKTDFSDEGHLNTNGSNKVATFLGEYLKNNYDLTDYRKIQNNLWELAENRDCEPINTNRITLPKYKIIDKPFNYYIDYENITNSIISLIGWAYYENDECSIYIENNGGFYKANTVSRPDVKDAFSLADDKKGFSIKIYTENHNYSLYLVNETKKEIYKITKE